MQCWGLHEVQLQVVLRCCVVPIRKSLRAVCLRANPIVGTTVVRGNSNSARRFRQGSQVEAPYLAGKSNSFPSSCNMLGPVLSEARTAAVMPCRYHGVRASLKLDVSFAWGLTGLAGGAACVTHDATWVPEEGRGVASLACVARITCRCLASRWNSNTLKHRGCFQTYRGRSSFFCEFCASCACPSASALRMPAWARRRVRCALLRSASRRRNAVRRGVASSWSCQMDFDLSLCFFLETFTKKVMGASAGWLKAEALRAARIPLSRVRFLRFRWVWAWCMQNSLTRIEHAASFRERVV